MAHLMFYSQKAIILTEFTKLTVILDCHDKNASKSGSDVSTFMTTIPENFIPIGHLEVSPWGGAKVSGHPVYDAIYYNSYLHLYQASVLLVRRLFFRRAPAHSFAEVPECSRPAALISAWRLAGADTRTHAAPAGKRPHITPAATAHPPAVGAYYAPDAPPGGKVAWFLTLKADAPPLLNYGKSENMRFSLAARTKKKKKNSISGNTWRNRLKSIFLSSLSTSKTPYRPFSVKFLFLWQKINFPKLKFLLLKFFKFFRIILNFLGPSCQIAWWLELPMIGRHL